MIRGLTQEDTGKAWISQWFKRTGAMALSLMKVLMATAKVMAVVVKWGATVVATAMK